jgi:ribosomal protein S8
MVLLIFYKHGFIDIFSFTEKKNREELYWKGMKGSKNHIKVQTTWSQPNMALKDSWGTMS